MMIDLHLLSKISGSDLEFRHGIFNKIIKKSNIFIVELINDVDTGNYNAAYYRLSHFQSSSSPYCNLNFINFISQMKFKLKTSVDSNEHREVCEEVLLRVQRGVEALLQRFPDEALRVA